MRLKNEGMDEALDPFCVNPTAIVLQPTQDDAKTLFGAS